MCVCVYAMRQTPILQDPNGHLLFMRMSAHVFICVLRKTPVLQDPAGHLVHACIYVHVCLHEFTTLLALV